VRQYTRLWEGLDWCHLGIGNLLIVHATTSKVIAVMFSNSNFKAQLVQHAPWRLCKHVASSDASVLRHSFIISGLGPSHLPCRLVYTRLRLLYNSHCTKQQAASPPHLPNEQANKRTGPRERRARRRTSARAESRRFWLLSALPAHTKVPSETDLWWETLRSRNRPGRARTVWRCSAAQT
jgi:hypothetical protein